MEFPDVDNSPLAVSRRENGHRYFQLPESLYDIFRSLIRARRGYPRGATLRGLQDPSELHRAANGDILVAVDFWRFEQEDEDMIAPGITSGVIIEYTKEAFAALLPANEI